MPAVYHEKCKSRGREDSNVSLNISSSRLPGYFTALSISGINVPPHSVRIIRVNPDVFQKPPDKRMLRTLRKMIRLTLKRILPNIFFFVHSSSACFSPPDSRFPSPGTGSYPPGCHGWHFNIRHTAIRAPRRTPKRSIASRAYCEQLGWNRHTRNGRIFPMSPWSSENIAWYARRNQRTICFPIPGHPTRFSSGCQYGKISRT